MTTVAPPPAITPTYRWLSELSQQFLEADYLLPGQTVDERFTIIAEAAERILNKPGFAAKFKDYIQRGFYTNASPILSNFGTLRGLPISCFGSFIEDSVESLLDTHAEIGTMTKHGGGTSAYMGNLRPRGSVITDNGTSMGPTHFAEMFDVELNVISQGRTRRGNGAFWLDVEHADILEWLTLRSEASPVQELSYGVCVSDAFMQAMLDGDYDKRVVWGKILQCRANTGYPYILFTDTVNRGAPDVYRDKGMRISHSNLCSEICLPDSPTESFVCDLSSMNDLYYDEWKDTDAVETLTYFLDAVMTEFIRKAQGIKHMERAVKFAENHRALGIGRFGYHTMLQSKMIPFESMEAKLIDSEISRTIQQRALAASRQLAIEYGEPPLLRGYGRRNTTLTAIAPTKSTACIFGQVSSGIEPIHSNYFVDDLAKVKHTFVNPYLKELLASKGEDTPETWDGIMLKGGSVQHLECLTEHEKNVFKTFSEISQMEIIIQASRRQKYIDQSQSLNIRIHSSVPAKEINQLTIRAWELGVKTLYYQKGVSAAQEYNRKILECESCGG